MDGTSDVNQTRQALLADDLTGPVAHDGADDGSAAGGRPSHSRVSQLRHAFEQPKGGENAEPGQHRRRLSRLWRWPARNDELLVANAECGMQHPRPLRPVKFNDMNRIVSLASEYTA